MFPYFLGGILLLTAAVMIQTAGVVIRTLGSVFCETSSSPVYLPTGPLLFSYVAVVRFGDGKSRVYIGIFVYEWINTTGFCFF